jgi:hypothetical protein
VGKIAVVVVHGVADQSPGTTLDQVASLLVANSPATVDYEVIGAADVAIKTPFIELPKSDGGDAGIAETLRICRECTEGDARAKDKDLVYRTRLFQMRRKVKAGAIGRDVDIDIMEMYWADQSRLASSGSRILSELLTLVFRLSELGCDTVRSVRAAASSDVSATDKTAPRPQRFRKTIASVKAVTARVRWRPFARSQRLVDVVLVHSLAMLALSFAFSIGIMCALAVVASWEPTTVQNVTFGAWLLLTTACALTLVYQWPSPGRRLDRLAWPLVTGIGLGLVALLGKLGQDPGGLGPRPWFAEPEWVVLALIVTAACGGYLTILNAASQRFGIRRPVGLVFWGVALLILLISAAGGSIEPVLPPLEAETRFQLLIAASVRSSEALLGLTKIMWMVAAFCVIVWFLLSVIACIAARRDYVRQGSISTGRLGFGLSMVTVLLLSMLLWAALSEGIRLATIDVPYRPIYFDSPAPDSANVNAAWVNLASTILDKGPASPAAASAAMAKASDAVAEAARCKASLKFPVSQKLDGSEALPSRLMSIDAACFMGDRYAGSTTYFAPIAAWMLVLLIFLIAMFLPSVLAEFGIRLGTAYQHGKWLTSCFRSFDWVVGVLLGVTALGMTMMLIDYFDALDELLRRPDQDWVRSVARFLQVQLFDRLEGISKDWLRHIAISAASVGTVFIVFGGLLSKYIPGLRAPLDVVLDVDNYFRSWPRGAAPRAMMMSRFDAVLRWLEPRYDQIVIVAHSQGTVIAADLLRLRVLRNLELHVPQRDLHFVTFGSPLRQLYAARFPAFYEWILRENDRLGGPDLSGTGIVRWINCFCSGDYVGRWLWSTESKLGSADWGGVIRHPASDLPHQLIAISLVKPPTPYEDVDLSKVNAEDVLNNDRVECCLGYGAHTKYFDIGQTGSAWMIDNAIARASMEVNQHADDPLAPPPPCSTPHQDPLNGCFS